ncbi:MAG: peptidylprolyl isomerase [Marinilabiliaceae bacterium]|nr:peptidylprolyl isomerase [Marinilabiliaceae bacterium]
MKKLSILFMVVLSVACANSQKGPKVIVHTDLGDMTIELYDETPQHRDNFLKLANEHYFDSLLFHRVIDGFMIQGGDPDSKNATEGQMLGQGGPDYTIPAEINYPKYFHKKGALAAARMGDEMNPEKESSGSQFYIVMGEVLNDEAIAQAEQGMLGQKRQAAGDSIFKPYVDSLRFYQSQNDSVKFMALYQKAYGEAVAAAQSVDTFKLPEAIVQTYKTVGGAPMLDGAYTVFGEVVEGLDVIDKIAKVEKDNNDRPLKNVKMWVEVIK